MEASSVHCPGSRPNLFMGETYRISLGVRTKRGEGGSPLSLFEPNQDGRRPFRRSLNPENEDLGDLLKL